MSLPMSSGYYSHPNQVKEHLSREVRAICFHCRTNRVKKFVKPSAVVCPDCGWALFWDKAQGGQFRRHHTQSGSREI